MQTKTRSASRGPPKIGNLCVFALVTLVTNLFDDALKSKHDGANGAVRDQEFGDHMLMDILSRNPFKKKSHLLAVFRGVR